MLATIAAILPLFALIAVGFACHRFAIFGTATQVELTRFVVRLALPVLMFKVVAEADPVAIWQPAFILLFSAGCLITVGIAIALRWRSAGPADALVDGMAAGYSNTAFLGIPLCLMLFGTAGLIGPAIASILMLVLLFVPGILLIELVQTPDAPPLRLVGKALGATLKNPLVVAPALGALVCVAGLRLPGPLTQFVDLLALAASPCALVSLGMFLAERRPPVSSGMVGLLTILKLVVQPLVTFLLVYWVWPLPPFWAKLAVIVAAFPTGTGPFMFAELYGRDADIAARVVLISTLASIPTIAVIMALL